MDDIKLKPVRTQSMKSVRSVKTVKSACEYNADEKPLDLGDFVAIACKKFPCPCNIIVKKEVQSDEYAKLITQDSTVKYKRMSLAPNYAKLNVPALESEKETEASSATSEEEIGVNITALYDNAGRLAEILMHKIEVPRMMIQILGLAMPHYSYLTKITISKCRISAYTIHEMSKFIPLTFITDICLDDSPLPQGNYALLLESPTKLTNLSLRRCRINDEVCKQIVVKLHFLEPAEATLSTLNLSSNHITDVGAKYVGEALRNNRHLRCLNLADNRIGDEGANHILHALIDFPLTYDEILCKRRRFMAYLRMKQTIYLKYLTQFDSRSFDDMSMMSKKSRKSVPKTKPKKDKMKSSATVEDFQQVRAEMMTNEMVGSFIDPFMPSLTKYVDNFCYCIGNMVLCSLNLCYNNLTYMSLKKLQAVLFYQSVNKKPNQTGLMRVLIEGNKLPKMCSELERIGEMLNRNVVNFSAKYVSNKLRARARISVIPERNLK